MLPGQKDRQKTECTGHSKGGLSTKIHTICDAPCDAPGNPLTFHLTQGQVCDLDGADMLLNKTIAKNRVNMTGLSAKPVT